MAARNSSSVQRRDANGLLIEQRRFFQELAVYGDPKKACEEADITWGRFKNWLSRDKHFQEAYDNMLSPSLDLVREMLETSAPKAAGVVDAALDSDDTMEYDVVCDEQHEGPRHFKTYIKIPNWQVKLRASEMIFKATKLLKDVKEISGTVTHMTLEDRIALASHNAGRTLPPNVKNRLVELKLIEAPREESPE